MPFDQIPTGYDLVGSRPDRLRYLADHVEANVPIEEIDMLCYRQRSSGCVTAYCAYGLAELLPVFKALEIPRHEENNLGDMAAFFGLDHNSWSDCSNKTGFAYSFGRGSQYSSNRYAKDGVIHFVYTKADVVRHLRTAADAVEQKEKCHAV